MKPSERLRNILVSTTLGPVTPYYGIVNGRCECSKPTGEYPVRAKGGKLKTVQHRPGKHPHGNDPKFQSKATKDTATIRQWIEQYPGANFGVIAGVETVVLDLDIRPEKNGVQEIAQLELTAGQTLPPTTTVLSGSGSGAKHLYFKIPSNLDQLQKPKGTKGIDFLRSKQGVIVPGSLHESGQLLHICARSFSC